MTREELYCVIIKPQNRLPRLDTLRAAATYIASLCLLALCTIGVHGQTAPVERYLLSDFSTAQVHVLNVADDTEVAAVLAGGSPAFMAVSPNGRIVYVSNINSNHISVIDLTLNPPAEVARIDGVHVRPMSLNGDGTRLVGFGFADVNNTNFVSVINTSTLQVVNSFPLPDTGLDPRALVVVGNTAYLQAGTANTGVYAVDLGSGAVTQIANTATGGIPHGSSMAATPDGKYVVALRLAPAEVCIISTATNTAQMITPPQAVTAVAIPPTAGPDGSLAYVAMGNPSTAQVMDLRPTISGQPNGGFGSFSSYGPLLPSGLVGFIKAGTTADGKRFYVETANVNAASGAQNVAIVDTSNPTVSLSVIKGLPVGTTVQGLAVAFTQMTSPATAPQVASVASNQTFPGVVVNSFPANLTVSGSGFSSDVKVRVGDLDTVTPSSGSSSVLQVPVPTLAAAQGADVIATNFNLLSPISDQLQSGILRGQLVIASPPTFQPANQVVVANFGTSTVSVLNVGTNASVSPALTTALAPVAVAISPDAERAYVSGYSSSSVGVFNLVNSQIEPAIALDGTPGEGRAIATIAQPGTGVPGGGDAVLYVAATIFTGSSWDQRLYAIDVNPASAQFEQVLAHYDAGLNSGINISAIALAAMPNGSIVYSNSTDANGVGTLVIYSVAGGAAQAIACSALGVADFQFDMQVSADGHYLLMNGADGSVKVLSLANPANPTPFATISPVATSSGTPFFVSFQLSGGHLFAFDQTLDVVEAFNFNPSALPNPDFALQGTAVIPGVPNLIVSLISVTPDSNLLYAALDEEDAVAVVSVPMLLSNASGAVLTKIHTGIGPTALAVRPGTPSPASTAQNPVVTVQPISAVQISLSNASAGVTSVATTPTNTTPTPLPAGFQVGSIPVFYEISTTATFTPPANVCFGYDPSLPPSQVSTLGVLHYDTATGTWQDVTVPNSLDTVHHTICGQVNSFSPFVIGQRTVGFITTQPSNQTVCAGTKVAFTAADDSVPKPTVHWQLGLDGGFWANIPGATSPTLSFVALAIASGTKYRAVFSNTTGSATTNAATLTVNFDSAITVQPQDQKVKAGQSATFTAAALGRPAPAVQWQVSTSKVPTWTNVPGASSTTLTFVATSSQNGARYRAVFTNSCGTATTRAAELNVY